MGQRDLGGGIPKYLKQASKAWQKRIKTKLVKHRPVEIIFLTVKWCESFDKEK